MKVVHRKDAKALKGDKSLSYQVISPDNDGSPKFLVTVVDIPPGGSTPFHAHEPGRPGSPCTFVGRGVGLRVCVVHPRLVNVERPDVDLERCRDGRPGPRRSRGRYLVSPQRESRLIGHRVARSVIEW